jgi:hypothetical protein
MAQMSLYVNNAADALDVNVDFHFGSDTFWA